MMGDEVADRADHVLSDCQGRCDENKKSDLCGYQMNSLITYTGGPATLSLETRYIQAGLFDATLIGPGQAGYNIANGWLVLVPCGLAVADEWAPFL
jgi:hypothetical protein